MSLTLDLLGSDLFMKIKIESSDNIEDELKKRFNYLKDNKILSDDVKYSDFLDLIGYRIILDASYINISENNIIEKNQINLIEASIKKKKRYGIM